MESASLRPPFAAPSLHDQLLGRRESTAPRTSPRTSPRSPLGRIFGRSSRGADGASWYFGAEGANVVRSLLATLPPEWTVFHSVVSAAKSNADHLVIGPGGIFTISTKHHGGTQVRVGKHDMSVDGEKVHYLRAAEFAAERVTELVQARMPLLAPVQPVIAFVNPEQLVIMEKPEQVKVIDAGDLRRWLVNLHPVLTAGEVQEVADLLDSPGSWRALPENENENENENEPEHAAAPGRMRVAGIRRLHWILRAALAVLGAGIAVLPLLGGTGG
ncbi:nuclease-related domain-containing protein [Cryobacterium shii]|nr:nuclease-related domain-containing protein [Cryobacterium shii]